MSDARLEISLPVAGSSGLRGALKFIFFGLLVLLIYQFIWVILEAPLIRHWWHDLPPTARKLFSLGLSMPIFFIGIGLITTGALKIAGNQTDSAGSPSPILAVVLGLTSVVLLLLRIVWSFSFLADGGLVPFWWFRVFDIGLLLNLCLFLTTLLMLSVDRDLSGMTGQPQSLAPYLLLWFTPVLLLEIVAYVGKFADVYLLPSGFSWISRFVYLFVIVALIVFTNMVANKNSWERIQFRAMNKAFYLTPMIAGWFISLLGVAGLLFIASEGRGRDAEVVPFLIPLALIPAMLGVAIPLVVLIYKMWAAIGDGRPRTTPSLAVALLFVPLFNLYWMFQAYWGWTKDFNRHAGETGLAVKRAPEGLALTICIFILLSIIPFLGILFALINQILILVFISKSINSVNSFVAVVGKQTGAGSKILLNPESF